MNFKKTSRLSITISVVSIFFVALVCYAAYNHQGDIDSNIFRTAYPNTVGTKLDSCTTCHSGGSYVSRGKTITLGSCQWCHYVTNYGVDSSEATLLKTLNSYGLDYKNNGRNAAALQAISNLDSDNDGFTNQAEINALTYPGDKNDDPTKVAAPSRVISLKELEDMPLHKQFMLMNASKSDDNYTKYSGVALENLVKAVMLDLATDITVFSPDGFATKHPLNPSADASSYHVFGIYPQGTFYYNDRADIAKYPVDTVNDPTYLYAGWCNYSSPSAAVCGGAGPGRHHKGHAHYCGLAGHRHDHCACRENESAIFNPEGLKMLLAFKRDGGYLTPGALNLQNKLDGEGPFRVVPPQKNPGPPDQRSTASNATDPTVWVWPYKSDADHNAGFSSRTVTMIKVEPLPAGTTDINTLEAGWPYVDEQKIVVYGSIDPYPVHNLNRSLDALIDAITSQKGTVFKNKSSQKALVNKVEAIKKQVAHGAYSAALEKLKEDVLKKTDGYLSGAVDANDWIKDLVVQQQLCSEIQKIWIMLVLFGA
jgi:hypothetical protein